MNDSEDASLQNEARQAPQNIPSVLGIPCVIHEPTLFTLEAKSDESIASEAPSKDPEFEMLNPPDSDEGDLAPLTKSGASSLGSFTEVESLYHSPGVEMTMEHSEMRQLLHEAGRESGESSNGTEERFLPSEVHTGNVKTVLMTKDTSFSYSTETNLNDDKVITKTVDKTDVEFGTSTAESTDNLESESDMTSGKSKVLKENEAGAKLGIHDKKTDNDALSEVSEDDDVTLFSSITYLGSSSVNAPVSDIELKRTMAILKQQSRVAIDVVLSVSSSSDGALKLVDPLNRAVIATFQLQKIRFCGRGDEDSNEYDCFAFNTSHGSSDLFHCHVFRCLESGAVSHL